MQKKYTQTFNEFYRRNSLNESSIDLGDYISYDILKAKWVIGNKL